MFMDHGSSKILMVGRYTFLKIHIIVKYSSIKNHCWREVVLHTHQCHLKLLSSKCRVLATRKIHMLAKDSGMVHSKTE